MAAGLAVTGGVAAAVYRSGTAMHRFEGSSGPTIFINWVTTAVGVLLFSAYTAYDVQRLKRHEPPPGADYVVVEKDAIVGALALHLDFVNLFLYVLSILGKAKR